MRSSVASILVFASAIAVAAQAVPTFDVASVKRSADILTRVVRPLVGETRPGGIWRATDSTVESLIRYAYPNHAFAGQITGLPDWARRDYFDIDARADVSASPDIIVVDRVERPSAN